MIKSQLLCQLSYAPACVGSLQKGKRIITFKKRNAETQRFAPSTMSQRFALLDLHQLPRVN
jgi:hypothetical protein